MTGEAGRRLRIAMVVHDFHRSGGHSRYVVELVERFAREHEVHLFASRVEGEVPPGVQLHHVPAVNRSTLATILTFALPASLMVRGDYDIVHAQGFSCFPSDVVTAHICNRAWHLAQRKAGLGGSAKERIFDGIVSPLEQLTYRGGGWVIACSRRIARDLEEHYGRRDRVSVVYHGVDLETFSPAQRAALRAPVRARLGLPEGEPAFLFVGDMRKGAAVNLEALARTPRGRMVFVTRSDPRPYREQAERLGVAERVIFCPPTDRVQEYYAAADAFVFPTPYDAFGLVISEAMASGLPVLTSREAGASELIEHERNGLILRDSSDAAEVARYLEWLAGSPEEGERLGREARATVESLSWDEVAKETMEVYEIVLRERAA